MLFMFAMTGWLQYTYISSVFTDVIPGASYIAFLFPIVIQVLRLVTGFLSASFLKKRRIFFGILVLLFSIWLSAFEYHKVEDMSLYWTSIEVDLEQVLQTELRVEISKNVITGIMTVLIWGALVLEFFLAAWLSATNNRKSVKQDNKKKGNGAFDFTERIGLEKN